MSTFEIRRRINAPPEIVYQNAHHLSESWDPLGQRIKCMIGGDTVVVGNRVKIIAWHGQSMVAEYVQAQAPACSAMKMVTGPRYLDQFAGTWLFQANPDGSTWARWRYHLRAAKAFRMFEFLMRLYFIYESNRRLAALAKLCEQHS